MENICSTFLGVNHLNKSIEGCNISLTTYAGDESFEEQHSHENCSISFLVEGTYKEDLQHQHFSRTPGNIKFVRSGEIHRCYDYTSNTKKINLDCSKEQLETADITEDQLFDLLIASPYAKFTLIKLYKELASHFEAPPASASIILYQLLNQNSSVNYKVPPEWFKKLIELLNDEWQHHFTLNDLSKVLGVHPVTISKIFPQFCSITLSRYLQKIKIEKALSMVRSSSLSLTEIAYHCGFADQGHFTRTFKDITGFLPKDFKKI